MFRWLLITLVALFAALLLTLPIPRAGEVAGLTARVPVPVDTARALWRVEAAASLPVEDLTTLPAGQPVYVAVPQTVMRAAPRGVAEPVGMLPAGQRVVLAGSATGGWLLVHDATGAQGYVRAETLSVEPPV